MSFETKTKRSVKLSKPKKFCNIFYNNDVTPFEVVMYIFIKVFNFDQQKANTMATQIHNEGKAIVFINTKEHCDYKKELIDQILITMNETHLDHTVDVYGEG